MTLRGRLVHVPVADDYSVDLPAGAHVVSVETADTLGLLQGTRPIALWVVVPAPPAE